MEKTTEKDAVDHIVNGIDKFGGGDDCDELAASKLIKENMDRQFGPSWHCIIGKGFSFEVTRQSNSTILLYYGGTLAVLLFKC